MATPTTECFTPLRGIAARVTRLDKCGRPVYGPCGQVTTDGFVTITYSMETEDGAEIKVVKANGQTCVADKSPDSLKWVNVEIVFCAVDPALVTLINPTWPAELDGDGNIVGWRLTSKQSADVGYALEVWTDVVGTDACDDPDADGAYGYVLLPWVVGGTMGDVPVANDAVQFTFKGRSKVNARWGVGPYNVVRDKDGKPGPLLVPIGKDEPMLVRTTTVEPPEALCGCQPLVKPPTDPLKLTATVDPKDGMTYSFVASNAKGSEVEFDFGDGSAPSTERVDAAYTATTSHTYTKTGEQKAEASSGGESADAAVTPAQGS